MTFCPVCDTDPCELDELRSELADTPFVLVDADQLAARKQRIRLVIHRVERSHDLVASRSEEGQ